MNIVALPKLLEFCIFVLDLISNEFWSCCDMASGSGQYLDPGNYHDDEGEIRVKLRLTLR